MTKRIRAGSTNDTNDTNDSANTVTAARSGTADTASADRRGTASSGGRSHRIAAATVVLVTLVVALMSMLVAAAASSVTVSASSSTTGTARGPQSGPLARVLREQPRPVARRTAAERQRPAGSEGAGMTPATATTAGSTAATAGTAGAPAAVEPQSSVSAMPPAWRAPALVVVALAVGVVGTLLARRTRRALSDRAPPRTALAPAFA